MAIEIKNNRYVRVTVREDGQGEYTPLTANELSYLLGYFPDDNIFIMRGGDTEESDVHFDSIAKLGANISKTQLNAGMRIYVGNHPNDVVFIEFIYANGYISEGIISLDFDPNDPSALFPSTWYDSWSTALLAEIRIVSYPASNSKLTEKYRAKKAKIADNTVLKNIEGVKFAI